MFNESILFIMFVSSSMVPTIADGVADGCKKAHEAGNNKIHKIVTLTSQFLYLTYCMGSDCPDPPIHYETRTIECELYDPPRPKRPPRPVRPPKQTPYWREKPKKEEWSGGTIIIFSTGVFNINDKILDICVNDKCGEPDKLEWELEKK